MMMSRKSVVMWKQIMKPVLILFECFWWNTIVQGQHFSYLPDLQSSSTLGFLNYKSISVVRFVDVKVIKKYAAYSMEISEVLWLTHWNFIYILHTQSYSWQSQLTTIGKVL